MFQDFNCTLGYKPSVLSNIQHSHRLLQIQLLSLHSCTLERSTTLSSLSNISGPVFKSLWSRAAYYKPSTVSVVNMFLRSADIVGRPFCCCIVFSFLFLLYFYFISFPLSAFCDFSAIFHRTSLIFSQLVDNNL